MNYFFITGTSKGIGEALTKKILENSGNKVVGISRSKAIDYQNYKHIYFDLGDIDRLVDEAKSFFPDLHDAGKIILINNAATLAEIDHVGNFKNENIKKLFDVNVTAPAILMNTFLERYISTSSEKIIINISSAAASLPLDGLAGYCSSKAALEMYSKTVAVENQSNKGAVKVFAIGPGIVDTAMQAEIRTARKDQFAAIDNFKSYKTKGQLSDPAKTAEKLLKVIQNPDRYKDVIFDIHSIS